MTYRGYDLRQEQIRLPGGTRYDSISIYSGDKRLAPTNSAALAKRVIDTQIAAGRWPRPDDERGDRHRTD